MVIVTLNGIVHLVLCMTYELIHLVFHSIVAVFDSIIEVLLIGAKTISFVMETVFNVLHFCLFGILGYD